jgi:integrase
LLLASFRKRSEKWEYRIKYTDPATGKIKEKTKGGFKTKKEAQIEAAEVEKQVYLGQHNIIQSKEILVKEWLNQWLEVYGVQCEKSTFKTRKFFTENHLNASLGHYKLNQLTKIDYQKFINNLLQTYARKTVQTIHSIFCTAINKAVDLEMITHNKFRNISIKKVDDISDIKDNYLTKDQVEIFLNAAKTCQLHHYMIASILIRTGLRKGELLALTWEDIDLDKKSISITKSRNDGIKPPKTKSSIRTIAIDNTLVAELKTYSIWQKKNKMKYGACYQESEFMMTSPNGHAMGNYGVNKVIDTILDKTYLHHISPHGLRHTHAIMLLESGADIKLVSDRLGHSSIDMTANVYIHITKKHEEKSILKLEAYLSNI